MALNGIQIFKLTPKKNCKECGCPTCMAFSMKVAQGAMKIEQCPHMSEDALASLSEATAPPMKTIKIGTGDGEFTLGGETVLFRHEKTFVSKTRYAVSLCTCMSDEEVEAKLAEIPHVDYDRIGERMHVELVKFPAVIFRPKKRSGIAVRVAERFGTWQAKRPTTHNTRSMKKSAGGYFAAL